MIALHEYQTEIVKRTLEALKSGTSPIIPLATGGGKTILAADVVRQLRAEFKRVLILVHRQEIGLQTVAKLKAHGVMCGAIMASAPELERPQESVQVAMIQTLHARCIQSKRTPLPLADAVIVDEAHHSPAKTYLDILKAYPEATKIGLTATPCRSDGRGLGDIFSALIEVPSVKWLIEQDYLVKPLIFAPIIKRDVAKGVKVSAGDYNIGHLTARMDTSELVGDIVSDYLTHGQRRPAICFAVSLAHAQHIVDEMKAHGIRAEFLSGETADDDRAAILDRLKASETEVVVNVAVLGEGSNSSSFIASFAASPCRRR
jgi:DNA repair protein RadD